MCQRKPCVVCPAPATLCSTLAQLLQRRKGSPQQGSALQTVFRRLRSSSPPLAAMKTALPSSTEQMTLRTTRVRKRGCTLLCLLTLCIAQYDDMLLYRRVHLLDSDSGPNLCWNLSFRWLWGTYWGNNQYYLSTIWLISGVYYEFHVGCKQTLKEPLSIIFN